MKEVPHEGEESKPGEFDVVELGCVFAFPWGTTASAGMVIAESPRVHVKMEAGGIVLLHESDQIE